MDKCSNRISIALLKRNMRQSELCEKTKIPKSAMSQYIRGTFEPKQDRLHLIANVLDVNPVWLMGYDVPMEKDAPETSRDERLNILYELTKELSEDELIALKGFVAGLKANRKPD